MLTGVCLQRIGSSLLVLLGERSQRNSFSKQIMLLYMYAVGASRQLIDVASRLGFGVGPTTIAAGDLNLLEVPQAEDIVSGM